MDFKRILIAVDGSPISINAVEKGISLAQRLQAEIGLVYVVDANMVIATNDSNISPQTMMQQFRQEGSDILEKIESESKVSVFKFLPEGKPAEEIMKVAEDWSADLIVIGTHGLTGLKRLLMGSVAEKVIRHSKRPVLVVTGS